VGRVGRRKLTVAKYSILIQGGHLPGNPGKVGEFESDPENVW